MKYQHLFNSPGRQLAGPSSSSSFSWVRWGVSSSRASTTPPSCRRATGATTWTWSRSSSTRPACCTLGTLPASAWCSSSRGCARTRCSGFPCRPPRAVGQRSTRRRMRRRRDCMGLPSRSRWTSCCASGTCVSLNWMSPRWPSGPECASPGRTTTDGPSTQMFRLRLCVCLCVCVCVCVCLQGNRWH